MTTPRYKRTKSLDERRERKKANQRKYRETHAAEIKAYQQRTIAMSRERGRRFRVRNMERRKEYYKEYSTRNREKIRERHRKKTYGINNQQWDDCFELQGRQCAICGATEPGGRRGWHGDHDHTTKRFRGILCQICNVMLGHAKDDIAILTRATEYLINPPFRG